jgi:hypothetical protein
MGFLLPFALDQRQRYSAPPQMSHLYDLTVPVVGTPYTSRAFARLH